MTISPFAGKPAPAQLLVDIPRLVTAYYTGQPDAAISTQRVAFGTSGHRGSSFELSFNEWHVLAISQAICLYREAQGGGAIVNTASVAGLGAAPKMSIYSASKHAVIGLRSRTSLNMPLTASRASSTTSIKIGRASCRERV